MARLQNWEDAARVAQRYESARSSAPLDSFRAREYDFLEAAAWRRAEQAWESQLLACDDFRTAEARGQEMESRLRRADLSRGQEFHRRASWSAYYRAYGLLVHALTRYGKGELENLLLEYEEKFQRARVYSVHEDFCLRAVEAIRARLEPRDDSR